MPNHVTNQIMITGPESRVREFFKQGNVEGDDRDFSFKGFVPPPDHPDYDTGGCSHQHPSPGMAAFVKAQFGVDMDPNHPLLVAASRPDEHPNCWYVWNRENWGTKWDCYDIKVGAEHTILDRLASAGSELVSEVVRFDTAWSPPIPVFDAMIAAYPDCEFRFRWMDEDMMGHGGGHIVVKNGEVVEQVEAVNDPTDPEHGKLWWEIARDLHDYTQEQYEERLAEIAEDERLAAEREADA